MARTERAASWSQARRSSTELHPGKGRAEFSASRATDSAEARPGQRGRARTCGLKLPELARCLLRHTLWAGFSADSNGRGPA